jgi:Ethanolamine utilization protein EutJ (predicted chaperonin)
VISRRGRDGLVEDYRTALDLVNRAAHTLEDASVLIGGAGESFTRKSVSVIDHLNDVYVEINQIKHQLSEVTPDD